MSRLIRVAALSGALVLAAAVAFPPVPGPVADAQPAAASNRISRSAFRAEMRKLWEDHIIWTRQYIVSAATLPDALPDIDPTAQRLFANQADIGAAIAPFYGEAAGGALIDLLNDHIAIAAEAIAAAKAGDGAGLDAALERWYANADDIASFLAEANPGNWHEDEMRDHMHDHLDLTLAEAVARLGGDYAADIAAYDAVHVQILHMADMLSEGIIAQFPSRFSS